MMGKVLKDLNSKKAKHQCNIRGCGDTKQVFALSRTREMGHTVLMCVGCFELLLPTQEMIAKVIVDNSNLSIEISSDIATKIINLALEKYKSESDKPIEHAEPKPSPFFSAGVVVEAEKVDTDDTGAENVVDKAEETHQKLFYGEPNLEHGEPVGLDVCDPTKAVPITGDEVKADKEVSKSEFKCKHCGKEITSKIGLSSHERACAKKQI